MKRKKTLYSSILGMIVLLICLQFVQACQQQCMIGQDELASKKRDAELAEERQSVDYYDKRKREWNFEQQKQTQAQQPSACTLSPDSYQSPIIRRVKREQFIRRVKGQRQQTKFCNVEVMDKEKPLMLTTYIAAGAIGAVVALAAGPTTLGVATFGFVAGASICSLFEPR